MFDINKFRNKKVEGKRYGKRIGALSADDWNTKYIEKTVADAIRTIAADGRWRYIYSSLK